jgi:hypothetical protein
MQIWSAAVFAAFDFEVLRGSSQRIQSGENRRTPNDIGLAADP